MPLLEDAPFKEPPFTLGTADQKFAELFKRLTWSKKWIQFFSNLMETVEAAPSRQGVKKLTAQAASIALTPLDIAILSDGLWRVSVHVRVTQPATTSSAIQVALAWTDSGQSQTESGTNLTGNLTTTREGKTFVLRVDANTPLSFSTTYASVGATPMQYALDIVAEEISADS